MSQTSSNQTTGAVSKERALRRRLIPFDGAVNFRDVGGYRANDGRTVKWGHLYRSDSLAELTDADLEILRSLELRSLCDLRHGTERINKPNRLPPAAPLRIHEPGFFSRNGQSILDAIAANAVDAAAVEDHLRGSYRSFPVEHVSIYAGIIDMLLAVDALPALIHCTSGKDRTGFAVTSILLALGIPRKTILEDYLVTNDYRRDLSFMVGDKVAADVLSALTQAHPSYLAAAFASIDEHWGSDEDFIRGGLQLTPEAQARLKDLLLE